MAAFDRGAAPGNLELGSDPLNLMGTRADGRLREQDEQPLLVCRCARYIVLLQVQRGALLVDIKQNDKVKDSTQDP